MSTFLKSFFLTSNIFFLIKCSLSLNLIFFLFLINHLKLNSNFYASLDVFKNEPINKNHKFWSHPNITITPHIASITDIESSIEYMYKNYLKFKKNGKIKSDVNIKKGY